MNETLALIYIQTLEKQALGLNLEHSKDQAVLIMKWNL